MDILWQLGGLGLSAFLSATVLPMASEAVFLALLSHRPEYWGAIWLVAGLGNTLGSLSSYALGWYLPHKRSVSPRALAWVRRYGTWALLLAWLPIVGDALPLVAGWLRLNIWRSALIIAMGKFGRYGVLLASALWLKFS